MGYTFRKKPKIIKEGNVLVIQPKDVSINGELDIKKACHTEVSADLRLKEGDVLLINRGRFTACVFDEAIKEPCVATSAFLIISPKEPATLLPEYLALFFNSTEGQNTFRRLTETTTIPFIRLGNLESIEIPLPSIERQKALATFGELNKAYLRLSSRKAELQKQIIDQQIGTGRPCVCPIKETISWPK